jgi:hypothetical protein
MSEDAAERPLARAARFARSVYLHVASVFACLGLAAMLGEAVHIDWRDFLSTLVNVWNDMVGSAVGWVLHLLITTPLRWAFDWHVEIPLWLRDYLGYSAASITSTSAQPDREI